MFYERVLARLFPERYEAFAMAQKQGGFDEFTFYTLDNEFNKTEPPHIHICVKKGTKGFKGKNLIGYPLMSVFKVKLNPDCKYSLSNIKVLEDYGNNFNIIKKEVVAYLNQRKKNGNKRGQDCLESYIISNGFGKFRNEYEKDILKFMDEKDIPDF